MNLINKKHSIFNYLSIPLKVSPVLTIFCILNKVIVGLIPMFQILVTADFVDTVIRIYNQRIDRSAVFKPLILLILIIVYTNINSVLMGFAMIRLEMRIAETFQVSVAKKRSKLEYWHIENNDTWEIISRVCKDTAGSIEKGFKDLLTCGDIIIRIMSVVMLLIGQVWWAALMIIVFSIPLFIVSIKSGKVSYDAFKDANNYDRKAEYVRSILTGRDSVEERTLFGYTDYCNKKWTSDYNVARHIEIKALAIRTLRINIAGLLTIVTSILMTGILINPLGTGKISVGMYIGLATAIFNMVRTISKNLTDNTTDLANDMEYMKELILFENLSETEGALDLPDIRTQSLYHSSDNKNNDSDNKNSNSNNHQNAINNYEASIMIEFRKVSFQYPGTKRYIVKDLSLVMDSHKHYAFVGINGAGKTTLTKLLTGLYDNYTGDIIINNRNLKDYSQAEIKGLFSVVYQDYAKYYIPLKDSVMLGNIHNLHDEKRLKEAIDDIELNDMLSKLPYGIDTPLGKIMDQGVDLSGGEWQRVAIARTIVNDAPILILDEPTAAIDPVAESNIYEMFHRISIGKSAIFITHRLGAAKLADEIFVIDDGKVAEQGSHDVLMKKNGIYANMFDKQRSWYQ